MPARDDLLDEVMCEIAVELGCEPDNEMILAAISKLKDERDRMRAALKPFSDMAKHIEVEHPGWYHQHFMFTDPQIKMTWLIAARHADG